MPTLIANCFFRVILPATIGLSIFITRVSAGEKENFFPVSEIRPGMAGEVLTVLQGREIVRLRAEILGVRENNFGLGKHMIVGKLVDERTALTGAVHGMSGSPLYIQGRMAGALSRRVAMFEKDGHCGFTPIHDMLEVEARPRQPGAPKFGWKSSPGSWTLQAALNPLESLRSQQGRDDGQLAIPLAITGGGNALVRDMLDKLWSGRGFVAADGSLSSDWKKPGMDLQPGAPVAAALTTGDIALAGTGTLTWREGNRVLGFGHPMLGMGEVAFPMCEADILTTVPSYARPYKMSNLRRQVGAVVQDRLSAIAGVVGEDVRMPGYKIRIRFEGQEPREFSGEFVSSDALTPMVLPTLVVGALMQNDDQHREYSIRTQGRLSLAGQADVRFQQYYSGDVNAVISMLNGLLVRGVMVYGQNFERAEATRFELDLDVVPRRSEVAVEQVAISPARPKRGEKISADIRLRPVYGEPFTRTVEFALPSDLVAGQKVTVEAASARSMGFRDQGMSEWMLGNGSLSSIGSFFQRIAPDSLAGIVAAINSERPSDQLAVRLSVDRPGKQVRQSRMTGLPPSVRSVIESADSPHASIELAVAEEKSSPLDAEIGGFASASVVVE